LKIPILKVILDEVFKKESCHLTTYSSNTLRFNKDDEIHFHVDYPYGLNQDCSEFDLLGVQVIITLNDFTIENGATLFIGKDKKVNYFVAPKGSLIIYRADIVHSQGINKTPNPRVGLLANFASIFVKAKDNIVDYACKTGLEIRDGRVFI
jgi:ectoine hydroxylase-related dioxygenase (phytanoyl-CoA dioxygenase family)